jgi:hypothetical protein
VKANTMVDAAIAGLDSGELPLEDWLDIVESPADGTNRSMWEVVTAIPC